MFIRYQLQKERLNGPTQNIMECNNLEIAQAVGLGQEKELGKAEGLVITDRSNGHKFFLFERDWIRMK